MATPRSCRFPPTPQLSARKRELFPSPLSKLQPFGPILSEISNTPRRSIRIAANKLTPLCENDENVTPSSRITDNLYLSDNSSDLGHMSPLELSSSPARYDSPFHNSPQIDSPAVLLARPRFFSRQNETSQLAATYTKDHHDQEMPMVDVDPETPRKSFSGIFIRKNPLQGQQNNQEDIKSFTYDNSNTKLINESNIESLLNSDSIVPETPDKNSPSINLRTPNEFFKENIDPPKLHHRKSITENISSVENVSKLKRHLSKDCFDNISNKIPKIDQIPKARTSLFSTKSFYSQTQKDSSTMSTRRNVIDDDSFVKTDKQTRNRNSSSINRKIHKRNGEINLGVRHKIRKPKPKRASLNSSLLNAALNIIENSPLNNYLNSTFMNLMPEGQEAKQNEKTVSDSFSNNGDTRVNKSSNLEKSNMNEFSISLAITENDNSSQENAESQPARKFFKNKRSLSNKIVKLQDNLIINIKSKTNKDKNLGNNNISNISLNTSDQFKDFEGDLTEEQKEVEKLLSEWVESDEPSMEDISSSVVDKVSSLNQDSQNVFGIDTSGVSLNQINNNIDAAPLSPTSQLSNMTSTMAIDSPAVASNSLTTDTAGNKLYPIFYKGYVSDKINCNENIPKKTRNKKLWHPHQGGQYQIDAGQKKIGLTHCTECDLVYQHAEPEEELFHYSYHNSLHILNFQGWKNECLISVLVNVGRIIHIKYNAPKAWHKRVQDVISLIDSEIGAVTAPYEPNEATQVYMMANHKQIIGLLVAKSLSKAHRMISSVDSIDLCTVEAFDVKCGVSRVWIAPPFRGNGYSSAMLNAMRCNFMFGRVLDLNEVAFSTPTQSGISLAKKYSKREDFLVFQEF